ncbi:hypothetical protein K1719_002837 [Acacia pycnantha]|nr:hypothetical protein K1719_002837 [Acacia pycnantha]
MWMQWNEEVNWSFAVEDLNLDNSLANALHFIDMYLSRDIFQKVLNEAGYFPSNREKYPLGGIISAIENAFHTSPQVICSHGAVEEIRLCFYKDFKPRDCAVGSTSKLTWLLPENHVPDTLACQCMYHLMLKALTTDIDSFSTKSKGHPSASATAPPKGSGMKLGKSQRINQFLESLKAEGEVILEDVQPKLGQSRPAAPPATDPVTLTVVTLTVEEKLNVALKRDGVSNFDVQGTLSLQILSQEDGFIQVQASFKTHPNVNKELFSSENILGLKDPNRPFPTGQAGDAAGVGLLKWRMQSNDESLVPLTSGQLLPFCPSVSGNETYVSIEYEASTMFELQNVVISVPLPALREAPNVRKIDGEWRYDSRSSFLEWSILLIDNSNRSGSLEFVVPPADTSVFFPISVRFSATETFSDLKENIDDYKWFIFEHALILFIGGVFEDPWEFFVKWQLRFCTHNPCSLGTLTPAPCDCLVTCQHQPLSPSSKKTLEHKSIDTIKTIT